MKRKKATCLLKRTSSPSSSQKASAKQQQGKSKSPCSPPAFPYLRVLPLGTVAALEESQESMAKAWVDATTHISGGDTAGTSTSRAPALCFADQRSGLLDAKKACLHPSEQISN